MKGAATITTRGLHDGLLCVRCDQELDPVTGRCVDSGHIGFYLADLLYRELTENDRLWMIRWADASDYNRHFDRCSCVRPGEVMGTICDRCQDDFVKRLDEKLDRVERCSECEDCDCNFATTADEDWVECDCNCCCQEEEIKKGDRTMGYVRFFKGGDHHAVSTTAASEDEFVRLTAEGLAKMIQGDEYDDDWNFQLQLWLPQIIDIAAKLRGYKADVAEYRLIVAGDRVENSSDLVVEQTGHSNGSASDNAPNGN